MVETPYNIYTFGCMPKKLQREGGEWDVVLA